MISLYESLKSPVLPSVHKKCPHLIACGGLSPRRAEQVAVKPPPYSDSGFHIGRGRTHPQDVPLRHLYEVSPQKPQI